MESSNETFHCASCGKDFLMPNQAQNEALYARIQRQGHQEPIQQGPKIDLRSKKVINCHNCSVKAPERDWKEHQQTKCENPQVPCEFCNQSILLDFYTSHADACSLNPSNINNNPEAVKVPCEFCGKTVTANVYEEHVNECARQYDGPRQEGQGQDLRSQQQNQRGSPSNAQNSFSHLFQILNRDHHRDDERYQNQDHHPQQEVQQNQRRVRTITKLPNGGIIIQERSVPTENMQQREQQGMAGVGGNMMQQPGGNMGNMGNVDPLMAFLSRSFGMGNMGGPRVVNLEDLVHLAQEQREPNGEA